MARNPVQINKHNVQPPFVCFEANGRMRCFL